MRSIELPQSTDARNHDADTSADASGTRWSSFRRLWRNRAVDDDDEKVRVWKGAWVNGAEARWAGTSATGNPNPSASPQAAAWRAGWQWADQQPNRRQQVRFAHPRRRSTDKPLMLGPRARVGALGLSILAVVGWFWQRRHRGAASRDGTAA